MSNAITNYIGRFAPSPTGPLHLGSLVAALASYLDARAHNGRWLLRIEDVDSTRCQPRFAGEICDTLAAFGFDWDGTVLTQSARTDCYRAALAELDAVGLTYACACSRREIADSAPAGLDGPVYPGTCRRRAWPAAANAVRILSHDQPIDFIDRVQGPQSQRVQSAVGDFVLKRRDGLFAYQLAVVVDDAEQGVTHVVRGADLLDSTARQIHLQRALALPTPAYLHVPVVTNPAGQKLSKQTLAPAISPQEACTQLKLALRLLGQSPVTAATPATLLAEAVRNWAPAAIPRLRTCHISSHTAAV